VRHWANVASGLSQALGQQFMWYNSSVGNADDGQASGAYIFRPNSSDRKLTAGKRWACQAHTHTFALVPWRNNHLTKYPRELRSPHCRRPQPTTAFAVATTPVTITLVTGPIVNEARQVFAPWCTQTVRLWAGAAQADFQFEVGPIPFADGLGREVVSRFTSDLSTNSTWITDSNGRDSMTRIFNYRPSWNLTVYEPAAGNVRKFPPRAPGLAQLARRPALPARACHSFPGVSCAPPVLRPALARLTPFPPLAPVRINRPPGSSTP
jgi:hypothetical protein